MSGGGGREEGMALPVVGQVWRERERERERDRERERGKKEEVKSKAEARGD